MMPVVIPAPRLIVGLEVHVQLLTKCKLFCGCATSFGAPPNSLVCPVCLGFPGAMPILNRQAFELAALAGLVLNSRIARTTAWDRKQYFYPDLPKGYQISQLRHPLCASGRVEFDLGEGRDAVDLKTVAIDHAHLEEDAGKSLHEGPGIPAGRSGIDLNRAGTPLLEIVTRPELTGGREARLFLTELRNLLVWQGVTDGNMQEGSLRCDANVNLEFSGPHGLLRTPISEIKNLNSLRALERAIDAERDRQLQLLAGGDDAWLSGGKQTRGWDDARGVSSLLREKEAVADYRYLPEPDLPPVRIDEGFLNGLRTHVVRTPEATRKMLRDEHGLSPYDARVVAAHSPAAASWFNDLAKACGNPKLASNWLQQDVFSFLAGHNRTLPDFPVSTSELGELLGRIDRRELPAARGRELLAEALRTGCSLVGLMAQSSDPKTGRHEMEQVCREILALHPAVVEDLKGGKAQAVGPLIGAVRKRLPNADPSEVRAMLLDLANGLSSPEALEP